MIFQYKPKGVCSRNMILDVENGIIRSVTIKGGCPGNLQGIARLVEGMPAQAAAEKLRGIRCGLKATSCPDQLAKALEENCRDV